MTVNDMIIDNDGSTDYALKILNGTAFFSSINVSQNFTFTGSNFFIGNVAAPSANKLWFYSATQPEIGMTLGITSSNEAELEVKSEFSDVDVFNINFGGTKVIELDNVSTQINNTLNVSEANFSTINASNIVGYQETLIAGSNITITGNTISSAGGGGTLPADANFSSVNTSTLNTSTIDSSGRVDIGDADGQSKGLVLTGTAPTITFKDTDARSGMIYMNSDKMFFLSGEPNSEAWSRVQGEWPLILHTDTNRAQFGGQLDCDLDAFHYCSGNDKITKGTNADLSWTLTRRGSNIQNGDSFRPKYSGKYSITLAIFLTANSSGQVRVGLKLNGSEYNLNGGAGTYMISANDANRDVNMFTGNIIVDAVAGQDIKAFVKIGTLRYYGSHSYLAGYYIGDI
jgi:hypothetical protein